MSISDMVTSLVANFHARVISLGDNLKTSGYPENKKFKIAFIHVPKPVVKHHWIGHSDGARDTDDNNS